LDCTAPPSEPDWRISRIRLSGRRYYLKRTGISMTSTRKAHVHIRLKGVSPGVPASSASRFLGSRHSPSESFQHAGPGCGGAPNQDSHRLSPLGHSRGWKLLTQTGPASAFLHPFAPWALPHFLAHMGALTPAQLTHGQPFTGQVSPVHTARPSPHSVTNHPTRPAIAFVLPTQRGRFLKPGLRPPVPMPCRGLANLWQTSCFRPCSSPDFTFDEQARRSVWPNRVRPPTDCGFVSSCSPPRLAATQLLSTAGSGHLPREDLHLSDRACFQAHSPRQQPGSRIVAKTGFRLPPE